MILKALEMQGFKSFPDKTVLEFNQGITAVVGPNGSGKSNISDAVRWVLGEQSTKNLRGSKMEDVVFSGTSVRKAKGFAEVTLRLDTSDGTLEAAKGKKEISVTRRYYRSGESEYLINGETARLRDINEMFMDTGLGRDGYSMVSQGKISEMISSKTGERREMLEEAAGISHFRYRRADAVKRLSQAEENLIRLRDILAELESRVGPLKTQSEKAQRFLVLAEERKQLEIGIWVHTIDATADKLREQTHKIETAAAQHKNAREELESLEQGIENAMEEARGINVKIEEIRNASAHFEEQAAALQAQIRVYENSIAHNKEAIARIERDRLTENETEQHIDEQIAEANRLAADAERKKAEAEESLSKILSEQDAAIRENLNYSEQTAALSRKVSALSVELADCRVTAETANSSMEEIERRMATIDDSVGGRQGVYERLSKDKADAEKALSECNAKITSVTNALEGYALRVSSRNERLQKNKAELEQKQRETAAKADRIRLLEDLEKNMEGYQGSVKAVMREVRRGNLRGVHGPLSQLITVPEKYALAVETAMGAAIQNIVTDNEADAKKAIGFLKSANAGRATFLPISAIRGRELSENGLDDCYGFINIASALVSADSAYREIVKAQLGRTAVAEDMDSAIAIAKKYGSRFRIVTLDGQLINAGGSMTGGSRAHSAGILSRGNEIERLRAQVEAEKQKLQSAEAAYKTLLEDFAAAKADYEGAQGDLLSANEEKIRCEGNLRLASEQLETAAGGVRELLEEKEALASRAEQLKISAGSAAERMAVLTKALRANEDELSRMTGESESLQKSREALSQRASEIKLQILSLEKDAQSALDTASHLESRKTSHTGRLSELDAEKAEIECRNEAIEKDIVNTKQAAEELQQQSTLTRGEIDALIASRENAEKRATELRQTERHMSAESERLSGEAARLEERKAAMEKEFEDLTSKLYDEYSLTRREAAAMEIQIEDYAAANRRLSELRGKIKALGTVNVAAIDEYKEVSERYEFMGEQIGDVEHSRDRLNALISELTDKMAAQFREQFNRINTCFGETFSELFGGGKAELRLEDEHDILECDIEIKVQPPGKNVQNINLLSGGEKGLSAIALLFAILKITPAPFCIFDEVEAALDDVNVSRYAQYVRRMTKNTQFILITHRRGTMEEADMLYGVTMQEEGVSKLLELKTAEMAKKLGLA